MDEMNQNAAPAAETAEPAKKCNTRRKKTAAPSYDGRVAALSFEDATARLEAVVRALESDTLPLDQSLSLYEEGIALVRRCSKELNEAEQKVRILRRTADGDIKPADFDTGNGE